MGATGGILPHTVGHRCKHQRSLLKLKAAAHELSSSFRDPVTLAHVYWNQPYSSKVPSIILHRAGIENQLTSIGHASHCFGICPINKSQEGNVHHNLQIICHLNYTMYHDLYSVPSTKSVRHPFCSMAQVLYEFHNVYFSNACVKHGSISMYT